VLCPLQAFVGAYDADVVPHETPQFIPVVGNDHIFIRVRDLAGIPVREGDRRGHLGQLGEDVGRCRLGIYKALQQRIAGHAVGAMQTGEAGFTNGIQARHIGVAMLVHHHPAAGVMCRRHHRDRLFGDVDGELQAALIDSREVRFDEGFGLVADIEIHAIDTQALHLVVDSAGDDISWRQLPARVKTMHEALAVRQFEVCAFAT